MALVAVPSGIRIALAVGLSGSAWCSGAIMACSYVAGDALLDPSLPASAAAHASSIWQSIYTRGYSANPPIVLLTASSFAYAAYYLPNPLSIQSIHNTRSLLTIAGLLTASIIPYTLLTMRSTNGALHAKAAAVKERTKNGAEILLDDGTVELLQKWNLLNFGRGTLPLLATGVGIYAIFF
ncbi:hypothetical protein BT96DRAFT_636760 [Gymnopus androsaceus JB14]|uniref:DUF1772-domain-containing protein n=1 Tax=Gymnopus androsaceus JB14 TaxID=1447944 RepID=A0A6A4HV91_9AGAR|nr:hypothetical protein BT96DRAFT_636760 [Gymnopus androsaceus JB14]